MSPKIWVVIINTNTVKKPQTLVFLETGTFRCQVWQWACGWQPGLSPAWVVNSIKLHWGSSYFWSKISFEVLELSNWLIWETHTKWQRHQKGIEFRILAICYNLHFILGSRQCTHPFLQSWQKVFQGNAKAKVSLDSESHCTKDSVNLSMQKWGG